MSFILNALRKSENERQRLSATAIAEFPIGRRSQRQPWWVYVLGVLLVLNAIVLGLVLLRGQAPQGAAESTPPAPTTAPKPSATPTAQMASPPAVPNADNNALRDAASPIEVDYETVPAYEREIAEAAATIPDGPALVRPANEPGVTYSTQTAEALNELRLDLHVYSRAANDRFVMINMRRYAEGQLLPNGATVEQITPTGVVLYLNGQRYQLRR